MHYTDRTHCTGLLHGFYVAFAWLFAWLFVLDFTHEPMTVGITQVILILIVAVLLFGNFRGVLKDFAEGIVVFKDTMSSSDSKDSEELGDASASVIPKGEPKGSMSPSEPVKSVESTSKEVQSSDSRSDGG